MDKAESRNDTTQKLHRTLQCLLAMQKRSTRAHTRKRATKFFVRHTPIKAPQRCPRTFESSNPLQSRGHKCYALLILPSTPNKKEIRARNMAASTYRGRHTRPQPSRRTQDPSCDYSLSTKNKTLPDHRFETRKQRNCTSESLDEFAALSHENATYCRSSRANVAKRKGQKRMSIFSPPFAS